MLGWLLNRKGQAMVEMALALPVLLLMTAGAIDMGLAFQQYVAVGNSAEAAARAAAEVLSASGFPVDAQGMPGWAVAEARRAALSASPNLRPERMSVDVAWDGPQDVAVRMSPPYRFRVTVPDAPNTSRDVDLSNTHTFRYGQPRVYSYGVNDTYAPQIGYADNSVAINRVWFSFGHNHGYSDLSGPWTWQQLPWGYNFAVLCGRFGCGFGTGPVVMFRTYAQAGSPWWRWSRSDWAWPGAWGTALSWPGDTLRRTWTDPFTNTDTANASWWEWYSGTFNPADGVFTVGPHALRRGDRVMEFTAGSAPVERIVSRPVVAVVRYRLRAFTPLLRPVLEGLVVTRIGVARVERLEAR